MADLRLIESVIEPGCREVRKGGRLSDLGKAVLDLRGRVAWWLVESVAARILAVANRLDDGVDPTVLVDPADPEQPPPPFLTLV